MTPQLGAQSLRPSTSGANGTNGSNNGVIPIVPTDEYIARLRDLRIPVSDLNREGYVVQELSSDELNNKKRCRTCGKRPAAKEKSTRPQSKPMQGTCTDQKKESSNVGVAQQSIDQPSQNKPKQVQIRCRCHLGVYQRSPKTWSCCNKPFNAPGCWGQDYHDISPDQDDALLKRWQYYPVSKTAKLTHRLAVAIDCEMGIAIDLDCILTRVTVLDYFSGERLLDSLVFPEIEMQHFNTRYSGVTRAQMYSARRAGQCLKGTRAAREAVLKFVGPSTIVVGHSANNDLAALRLIHHHVVDTYVIENTKRKKREDAEARRTGDEVEDSGVRKQPVPKKKNKHNPEGLSLKALTLKRLGRDIQTAGKAGHDSLEDALAARDLLHWHIMDWF